MKRSLFAIALASVLVFAGVSCNKYEEGPKISLRSKTARVAGTWVIDKYIDSDGTETQDQVNTEITYDKDGGVSFKTDLGSYNGTWAFNDDKTQIITTVDLGVLGESKDTATITKLKHKEFWTKDEDNDQTHLKAKE